VKAALRCPEKYSVCMGLSGARDPVAMYKVWQGMENGPDLRGVEDALGPIDEIYGSENDILYLAKKAAESGKDLPRFFLSCGKEDYAVEYSRAYHQYLKGLGIAHAYYETEGAHGYEAARKALEIALEAMQKEGILK
jgi:S-formylglutathione hydrolase FrmB